DRQRRGSVAHSSGASKRLRKKRHSSCNSPRRSAPLGVHSGEQYWLGRETTLSGLLRLGPFCLNLQCRVHRYGAALERPRHARQSMGSYKDLNWQRVIDDIAAEIWIVTVGLDTLVCSARTCQQRIAARLCRRDPIVSPAPPCMADDRVEEIALNPRGAAIEADRDLGDIGISCPSGTEDGIGAIGLEPLVGAGARDLRLQFHLR